MELKTLRLKTEARIKVAELLRNTWDARLKELVSANTDNAVQVAVVREYIARYEGELAAYRKVLDSINGVDGK